MDRKTKSHLYGHFNVEPVDNARRSELLPFKPEHSTAYTLGFGGEITGSSCVRPIYDIDNYTTITPIIHSGGTTIQPGIMSRIIYF